MVHHQPFAIHFEFVALGFASEDGMVVQNQTVSTRMLACMEERRGEAADSATDNNAIIFFARVGDVGLFAFKDVVANSVPGGHHFIGVAV